MAVLTVLISGMVAIGLTYGTTSLAVTVISDLAVVDPGRLSLAEKLSVTFDGEAVTSLRAYEIEVRNDGTRPIRARDFESPLAFSSLSERDILAAEIRTEPSDAIANIEVRDGDAVPASLLLDSSDRITIGLVSTASGLGDVHASARIAGISRVAVVGPDGRSEWPRDLISPSQSPLFTF